MRRKLPVVWIAMLLSTTTLIPSYAAVSRYETDIVNHVSIGDINISLNEYELDADGNEIPYNNHKLVLPGDRIDKIVRVTNQANSAWLRMKIEYVSVDGIQGMSDEMLTLDSEQWEKIGEYWYWKQPISTDQSIDFIRDVKVPSEWDESYSGKKFSIVITAEAVQEANFTPDFTMPDPWFGTIIETCVHSSYETTYAKDKNFLVVFEDGTKGLVQIGDDFFSGWDSLMPGDIVSDTVTLKNNYRKPITLYFHTKTVADDALLKALNLMIKNGEQVIYDGSLAGEISKKVKLATLGEDETATLSYTLTVPAELNNDYAMASTKTRWIFSTELRSGGSSGGGGGSGSGGADPGHGPGVQSGPEPNVPTTPEIPEVPGTPQDKLIFDPPKMGDDSLGLGFWAAMMATSLCGMFLLLIGGKRKEDSDEKQ